MAARPAAVIGDRAIRFDMLERLEDELEKGAASGANAAVLTPKLVSLLGSDNETLEAVLAALGWRSVAVAGDQAGNVWRFRAPRRRPERAQAQTLDSPFAGLAARIAAR